ncbi:MAG TPA: ATP-binding cassette domain-containing protein [Rubrivivax sp.]|nr:ATP-binding cassette domain-containing protein [Rubrivivax sp.]
MKAPLRRTLISLHDAGVSFGDTQALHGVTLDLRRGDRLMLVGANGSGKTTLIRLLHGLLQPDVAGSMRTHDLVPEGRPPRAAMVFQRPFLLNLSVRWNVLLGLWLRGVPASERESRCRQALQRVGLVSLAGRRARELSGGQQQRLTLARAWALQPDILFLDEPTASLDPGAKREVEALILDVAADGVTLVMSTHNLGQARRLGTRVAYLEAGTLVVDRTAEDFFTVEDLPDPASQFLKGELPWHT